jgi:hypothetical protein
MRQKFRVLAHQSLAPVHATGGDGFADRDAKLGAAQTIGDRPGHQRLADAGVGAGDEQSREC